MNDWTGCGECDNNFPCFNGHTACIRLPKGAALERTEKPMNYFEVQRIANERGLDYNKLAGALRDYAALEQPEQEPLGWAVQVGTHGAGRRRDKPRYTIFFDKAAAENLAYRTGTHPKPFYIGGNDD